MPDIDIDFANRELALAQVKHVIARLDSDKKHNTGVYVQPIPCDPISRLSTIDYKTAEDRGYFKLDFLNTIILKKIKLMTGWKARRSHISLPTGRQRGLKACTLKD